MFKKRNMSGSSINPISTFVKKYFVFRSGARDILLDLQEKDGFCFTSLNHMDIKIVLHISIAPRCESVFLAAFVPLIIANSILFSVNHA